MKRRQEREQAFYFVFESLFSNKNLDEITNSAKLAGIEEISEFAKKIFEGTKKHKEKIEQIIDKNLNNWKKERLPKTTLAILSLSIFEMLYNRSIDIEITINEAVNLAKKFASPEDAAYINGVLGTVNKTELKNLA